MTENTVLSPQILTEDAARAYEAHALKCAGKAGDALARMLRDPHFNGLSSLQDVVWELALDFTAPLEPYIRDELRAAETGLPWGARCDVEFYWKIMYAAHVDDITDRQPDEFRGQTLRRPIKETVTVVAKLMNALCAAQSGKNEDYWRMLSVRDSGPLGHALYQGVVERAGHQIRLRAGLRRQPKPVGLMTRVRVGDVMAEVAGYDLSGDRVIVSRETEPSASAGIEWKLDVRRGRWDAAVAPWRVEAAL